jgi:hypothetical protein
MGATASLALVVGCVGRGALWNDLPYTGPLIEGNKYAAVVKSCDEGLVYYPTCEVAFVDHRGAKVQQIKNIQKQIDDFLPKLEPIVPWLKVQVPGRTSQRPPNATRLPYRFHILTISPLVVLAVPRLETDTEYCSGNMFETGCIHSALLPIDPYWYKRSPRIAKGTFWFSPDMSIGATALSDEKSMHTIKLPSGILTLIEKDGVWQVGRGSEN